VARILVVDDNAMMRSVLRMSLQRAGHEVVLAEDGVQAMKTVGGDQAFDLIITDVQMPKMDGADLVPALRKSLPDVKILVISGRVDGRGYEALSAPTKLGADGALEKPFTSERLIAKLAELLPAG
jgi:CheY-like chemotaxis protein